MADRYYPPDYRAEAPPTLALENLRARVAARMGRDAGAITARMREIRAAQARATPIAEAIAAFRAAKEAAKKREQDQSTGV